MDSKSILSVKPWPMSTRPKLYSFRRCPYAMRARLALWASGLEFDTVEVNLKQKPPQLWAVNPLGTVPVLVWSEMNEQRAIAQSFEIMLSALTARDPNSWLPQCSEGWRQVKELIEVNDGSFKHHLDRYKYPNRYAELKENVAREAGSSILFHYEKVLQKQNFLAGKQFGLSDACVAPFVRQFARTDLQWFNSQNWPKLIHWLETFESSEAYLFIMQKS